jgi:two-component system, NarL family, invasion response regulator UvrY
MLILKRFSAASVRGTRILVVDDHPIFRGGIVELLRSRFGEGVFAEVGSLKEAISEVTGSSWDLVILDLFLGSENGLDLLRLFKGRKAPVPVIVLSRCSEETTAKPAFRLGARGYISKDASAGELLAAVAKVLAGGMHIPPKAAEILAMEWASLESGARSTAGLSPRERSVLGKIGEGMTSGEIAAELGISPKTVSTFRARIMKKLGANSKSDLRRRARELDLTAGG